MAIDRSHIKPGRRVRVIQQMPQVDNVWSNSVEGVITRVHQSRTGSWFAHARHDQLWLDRLELRKDDGELVTLVLDQYSVVNSLDEDAEDAKSDTTADPDGSKPLAA